VKFTLFVNTVSAGQLIQPLTVKEFGKLWPKETYISFNGDLDSDHYDELFSLQEKKTIKMNGVIAAWREMQTNRFMSFVIKLQRVQ
jgi:hypothetical protein